MKQRLNEATFYVNDNFISRTIGCSLAEAIDFHIIMNQTTIMLQNENQSNKVLQI